jgi:hypothetical protein
VRERAMAATRGADQAARPGGAGRRGTPPAERAGVEADHTAATAAAEAERHRDLAKRATARSLGAEARLG